MDQVPNYSSENRKELSAGEIRSSYDTTRSNRLPHRIETPLPALLERSRIWFLQVGVRW